MSQVQVSQLEAIMSELESVDRQKFDVQSIAQIVDFGKQCMGWMAFSNSQMALAKKEWNEAVAKAHLTVQASLKANNVNMPASLQNDYVKRKCSEQEYAYDVAERCSRTCTHFLDFLRTVVSALKQEIATLNAA